MWSSTLPTGTVREEGRGSRTFPERSTPQPQLPQRGGHPSHELVEKNAALQAEVETLEEENRQAEAEIQRLESQVSMLRKQLANHKQAESAMVDRYERIISELEAAAATDPERTRASKEGLLGRLKRRLL